MTEKSNLVSVCIVAYNNEKKIYHSIASILDQTYQNIEVIIVDDFSTDNTVEIIENIYDDRIQLIKNNKRRGIFASRKIALQYVSGAYVAMMGQNDIAVVDRIQSQVAVMKDGYDFCGGWAFIFGEDFGNVKMNVFKSLRYNEEINGRTIRTLENKKDVAVNLLFGSSIIDETVIFSRKFLDSIDDFYEQKDGLVADYMLWTRLFLHKKVKFKNIQKVLVYFKKYEELIYNDQLVKQDTESDGVRKILFEKLGVNDNDEIKKHNQLIRCKYKSTVDVEKLSDFYKKIIAQNETYNIFDNSILLFYVKKFIDYHNKCLKNNKDIQLSGGTEIILESHAYICDVTFIVPFYNTQRFLKECLDSIQSQKGCTFEVIMIDNGSTDNSASIAKEYLSDARFKYIYQKIANASIARNAGIECAKGKHIAFVDADDYITDDFCEVLLSEINQCDILVFGYKSFDEYSDRTDIQRYQEKGVFVGAEVFPAYTKRLFGWTIWHKLYKAELIKTIRFDDTIYQSEDEIFCIELFAQARSVQVIDYIGYMYRQRQGAMTKMRSRRNIQGVIKIGDILDSIFQKYSLDIKFEDECIILKNIFLQGTFNHLNDCVVYEGDDDYLQLSLMKRLNQECGILSNNLKINKAQFQKEIIQTKQGIKQLKQQSQQQNKKINDFNHVVQQKKQENRKLKNSKSFQLGDLFFRTIKSPYKLITFPLNFIKILVDK